MITVDEAWQKIQELATVLEPERVPIATALGAVAAEDLHASIDLPGFDNSAMDGYALRSQDTEPASPEQPVWLKVKAEVAAGQVSTEQVEAGQAMQIMTGAPLPDGCDSVLQLEAARFRDGSVEVKAPVPSRCHVRRRGEDVEAGELVVAEGGCLGPQRLTLAAAVGIDKLEVVRRPRIAVLATGSELIQPGERLAAGQIYDANRLSLQALLGSDGWESIDLGIVPDSPDEISERLAAGLDHDVVLVSGGVSVGRRDYVKAVLRDLGAETIFWRVRMKPGKPLLCARRGSSWVFGLPGNPISCVVGYLVFVEPLLRTLAGHREVRTETIEAQLTEPASKRDERRTYLTASVVGRTGDRLLVRPTSKQGSAMMGSLAEADGFVVVPEARDRLEVGERAQFLPIPRGRRLCPWSRKGRDG